MIECLKKTMKTFFFLLGVVFLVGCAPAIPREYLNTVNRSLTYALVKTNVNYYMGATVAWGGYIHETRNTPEGTYIEVIESPLGFMDRPEDMDQTGGRFLILYPGYAETVQYSPGRAITVVGELRGVEKLPLGNIHYSYPVLLRRYDKLWKEKVRPDIHLGIGVGTVFTH